MKKILVVDPVEATSFDYQAMLAEIKDAEVMPLAAPLVGLAWANENHPDLIVVEYSMPGMTGLEFVETYRKRVGAEAPVIMITSAKDRAVRQRALQMGIDDFLERPVDPVEFIVRARNLLKLRERSQKLADRTARLAEEVRKATAEISRRELETIHRLTRAAEYRDADTRNHIVRIGLFARALARAIGLSEERQELLRYAAPMHDIGKVAIPDRILLKKSRLTPMEWQVMMTHSHAGYDILCDSDSPLLQLGAEIALSHHEKFDGSGYPRGLKGEAIPLSGRIVAIADVFDAMLSTRPYKGPWKLPEVIETLRRGRGLHFDPRLIDAFLDLTPELQRIRSEYSDEAA